MSITDEEAKGWASRFIRDWNEDYEYLVVYEDEEFTEKFPDETDWERVHDLMLKAKVTVSWDD